jgi:hypothetical protein
MGNEAWLKGCEMDASMKISVIKRILAFDFEFFIGVLRQNKELMTIFSSCHQP